MFKDPQRLLYELGKAGTLLSGSRALEYFVKDSAIESSDWDFYCRADLTSIYSTVTALGNAGVTWITMRNRLKEIIYNTPFEHIRDCLSERPFRDIVHNLYDEDGSYIDSLSIDHIRRIMRRLKPSEDYNGNAFGLLKGTITKNGISQPVQLIYSQKCLSPIQVILKFHSSIVQCFISFSGAAHLYYESAIKKISYFWSSNTEDMVPGTPNKYIARGFQYVEFGTNTVINDCDELTVIPLEVQLDNVDIDWYNRIQSKQNIRSIDDEISKFIPFNQYYDHELINSWIHADSEAAGYVPRDVNLSAYMTHTSAAIRSICWHQLEVATLYCQSLADLLAHEMYMPNASPFTLDSRLRMMQYTLIKKQMSHHGTMRSGIWNELDNYMEFNNNLSDMINIE